MNVFEAGVTLHLVDKVSSGLGQIAKQFAKSDSAASALQKRLDKIHSTFKSGVTVAAGGMALASPLIFAAKSAMDLQTALGRVQIATGANDSQMRQLNETLTKTANITGIFSKPVLASFAAEMYSSGISDIKQINEMLPLFAQAADITKILSHGKIGAEDTLHTLVALSHQYGRYDSKSMEPIVEAAVAMSKSLPGGMKTLKGMGSYVNIMGNRALGIDPVQLMAIQAGVAQTSGGQGTGKGALSGANLINFLQRSMPGVFGAGLLSGKSAWAGATLGLSDRAGASTVMKNGKMDLNLLQSKLEAFGKLSSYDMAKRAMANVGMLGKNAEQEIPLLQKAISSHGKAVTAAQLESQLLKYMYGSASTIAKLMGDDKFIAVVKKLQREAEKARIEGGIAKMQEKAMEMMEPQLLRLQNNLVTLASTIGDVMTPTLTKVITKLGDIVDKVNTFATHHPRMVKAMVAIIAVASAAMVLGGAALMLRAGFMGLQLIFGPLLGVFKLAGPIIKFVASGLGPLASTILPRLGLAGMTAVRFLGPLGIAIAAVALVVQNWDKIMKFVHENQKFFINIVTQVVKFGDKLNEMLKKLGEMLGEAGKAIAGFVAKIPGLKELGAQIQTTIANAMKVDAKTDAENRKYLASKGLQGVTDTITGTAKAGAANPAPKVQVPVKAGAHGNSVKVGTVNNNITVQQVPGHDHNGCIENISKALKRFGKDAAHAANAASGNTVGRAYCQFGNSKS